jgi:hypothetical protein
VFQESFSNETAAYPLGENIYVQLSQSAREIWDYEIDDGSDEYPLSDEVDTLVENLRDYVNDETSASLPDESGSSDSVNVKQSLDIHVPGDEFERDSDYLDQCGQQTGGFSSALDFVHNCQAEAGCEGDTIASLYTFEVDANDGNLGGGGSTAIPQLTVNGTSFPEQGSGQYTWIDVDPFDGDPDRNHQESSAPPT